MLQEWAGEDVLLRADHFFWLLGAAVQKSVEGLLRSLVYSILLGLSRSEFPDRLDVIATICLPRSHNSAHSAWGCKELKDVIVRLTSMSGVKIFFLIDALDECEPQDNLGDLATEILWMSRLPNVKLCVSHRPWAIFSRKFEHAATLRLDQLTIRDMETYVKDRLTIVEEEKGWYTDFGDQTQAAERFVRKVAHDAEGVFFWIELVVKAISSEMRKGRQLHQLDKILSDFPTDLDDYFRKLIFDRIGRSRQNMKDTAAALQLAIEISLSEKKDTARRETPYPNANFLVASPLAHSLVNFWLLGNGHLMPGFSWQDYERITQPSNRTMLRQTASFLEETCKDLLVLNESTSSVDFCHRTVFDFLNDGKVNATLKENAPSHFSDEEFIINLAKLRCVCILRKDRTDHPIAESVLEEILRVYRDMIHLDMHASWLLTCESLTISQMQKQVEFSTHATLDKEMEALCAKAGLNKFVVEVYKHMPFYALVRGHARLDLLGTLLQVTANSDIRSPDLELYRYVMELGCDPNTPIGAWPYSQGDWYSFGSKDYRKIDWCLRTTWQAWLGEAYVQTQRRVNAEVSEHISTSLDMQKQWLGSLVELLLQYGADPRCTVCITDHREPADEPETCNRVALQKLLGHIVPEESTVKLQRLRNVCSDSRVSHVLRRNQQKRALRSLLTSEVNLSMSTPTDQLLRRKGLPLSYFLDSLTGAINLFDRVCNGCSLAIKAALVTWCVECQGQSYLCLECSVRRPVEVPGLISPCTNSSVSQPSRNEDHTSITFVWEEINFRSSIKDTRSHRQRAHIRRRKNKHIQAMWDYANLLHARHPIDQAIGILEEWYEKDPIRPDLTFEEAIGGIAAVPTSFEAQQTSEDNTAGEISAEVRAKDEANSQEFASRKSRIRAAKDLTRPSHRYPGGVGG